MTRDLSNARPTSGPSPSPSPEGFPGHASRLRPDRPRGARKSYPVVPILVLANVATYACLLVVSGRMTEPNVANLLEWGANFGPRTLHGQWWRLFTSMFLHFDVLHLGLNMWVLWKVGRLVERLVGSATFATLYVAAGLLGSVASLAWNPSVISAGASGAVFGVVGALFAFVATNRAVVPAELFRSLRGSLVGFLGYNLLFGLLLPGIDMAAHMGGLAAGAVSGMLCGRPLAASGPARSLRYAALLVGPAAVLVAAVCYLPQPPADVQQQLGQFARLESQAIKQLDELSQQVQQGLSDDQLAQRVQRDIQPVWRKCESCVQAARSAPLADQQYLSRLIEYVALRQRSCNTLVEGLQQRDAKKIQQFNRLYESANRMALEINGKG